MTKFYYKNNRGQQLTGFYNVVQAGGVSAAAKKMNLTQSAVSQQIASLERDLNVKLFDRSSKKAKLTKEGKIFYTQSVQYVQGINDLFESFNEYILNKKTRTVRIASNHVGISYILPKYLKLFRTKYPKQSISIYDYSIDECEQKLLNNEVDFFIYPILEKGVRDEFEFIPVVEYKAIALMHKDNGLARKKKITLSDVSKENLLRIDPHLITLPCFEELLKSHKIKSNIEFINSDWEILRKYVKADLGIAMISAIILEGEDNEEYVQKDLTDYFPVLQYGIYVKKGKLLHNTVKDFINIFKNQKLLQAHR